MPSNYPEHESSFEFKAAAFDAQQVLRSITACRESRSYGIIAQQIHDLGEELWPRFKPRYTCCVSRITDRSPSHFSVALNRTAQLTGRGIYKHLQAGEYAVVFFLTVGCVRERLKELSEDDLLKAYLLHSIATTAVHANLRLLQQILQEKASQLGYRLGRRFAPGYRRWDLREQKKLFEMTRANGIGLTLSSSFSLLPEYSISGVYNMTKQQPLTSRPGKHDQTSDRLYA